MEKYIKNNSKKKGDFLSGKPKRYKTDVGNN